MKYSVKFLISFLAAGIFSVSGVQAARLLVEDFNRTSFIGPRGPHNVWMTDPDDPTGGAKADFVRTRTGYALKLSYNIDSPASIFWGDTYIQDYSEYSIIGKADGIPHLSPAGYYFLLGEADLRRYKYLVFSARGDEYKGYTRKITIDLKTENRTSSFILTGISQNWRKFTIPLNLFDTIDDWSSVTEITISFNETATAKRGVIYLNNVYFADDPDDVPQEDGGHRRTIEERPDFEYGYHQIAEVSSNFRHTPERGSELFTTGGAVVQGKSGRLTGRLRAAISSEEAGTVAYREVLDEYPYTRFVSGTRELSFPTIQLKVNELSPLASRITLGHLYLGYSKYLFSPFFGWQGIKAEGSRNIFDHSTFVIKKQLNSFSAGSQMSAYPGDHRFHFLGIYDYETAKLNTSGGSPGFLADGGMDIREVSNEFAWEAGALLRFLDYRVNIELNYADYRFKELAEADYSDPAEPVFSREISEPAVTDSMHEAKLYLKGLPVYGSKLLLSYRNIGTDFAPNYRQEPILFEELTGDQRGLFLRGEQWYNDFGARIWWDSMERISDSSYGTRVLNYGLMYRGRNDMELGLSREHKEESYKYAPRNIDFKDIEQTSFIIDGKYNFFYTATPGIRFPLTLTVQFREDVTDNLVTDEEEVNHSVSLRFEYHLRADLGFSAVYRASTRNDSDDLEDKSFNMYISGTF